MNKVLTDKEAELVFLRFDKLGRGRISEQDFIKELKPLYK